MNASKLADTFLGLNLLLLLLSSSLSVMCTYLYTTI